MPDGADRCPIPMSMTSGTSILVAERQPIEGSRTCPSSLEKRRTAKTFKHRFAGADVRDRRLSPRPAGRPNPVSVLTFSGIGPDAARSRPGGFGLDLGEHIGHRVVINIAVGRVLCESASDPAHEPVEDHVRRRKSRGHSADAPQRSLRQRARCSGTRGRDSDRELRSTGRALRSNRLVSVYTIALHGPCADGTSRHVQQPTTLALNAVYTDGTRTVVAGDNTVLEFGADGIWRSVAMPSSPSFPPGLVVDSVFALGTATYAGARGLVSPGGLFMDVGARSRRSLPPPSLGSGAPPIRCASSPSGSR